ncbi:deoxyribonuclease IV [Mesoplasma syrphidae]|uniref:Probable endonuclease 4 n=1 Tax=Mesoplasma syrphidae TaxID=225999 RepID=A0A2K9CD53_9MOLU|nr:deoxyribonuclease IV [Mesoplasma syrphidae]AUF83584.1 deoxyribonuclease IV [Mesoplasma syrphidae]
MKKYPILGSHVSASEKNNYLIGAVTESVNNDANTFMIYTGPPQNANRKPIENFKIAEMHELLKKYNLDINDLVVHAPYLINISNPVNEATWNFGIQLLIREIERCEAIGINILVLHPGAYTKGEPTQALEKLIEGLNLVSEYQNNVRIAIETMSGKGTEVGTDLQQIAYVISKLNNPEKVGVCLDTCHMNDAGYDLSTWSAIKETITKTVGSDKILVFHLNDSKNPIGAHKDRHENIGYGTIGFEILNEILWDTDYQEIPKILETPYVRDVSPYKAEISDLRNKTFTDPFKSLK